MAVTELAETSVAYFLGELAAMSVIPIAGAIMLIVGLRRRSRGPQLPQGYPPPESHPDGLTPDPYQPPPTPPQYYLPAHPARSSTALILVGLLLLGAGLLGIVRRAIEDLAPRHHDPRSSLEVGQCITQSSFDARNMAPAPQDCDDPSSTMEVASASGASATCPDGKLRDSQYAVLLDKSSTLCFLINLKEGQCYSISGSPESPTFAASSCDGLVQVIQVVTRIDGNSDHALCPAGTKAVSYPKPARLYCLQPLRK